MATLSNPTLDINVGKPKAEEVTATATVEVILAQEDLFLNNIGVGLLLEVKLFGDDDFLNGADDDLYTFPISNITSSGIYSFPLTTSLGGILDEDNAGDEIFATFRLNSTSPRFPLSVGVNSPTISGKY